MVDVYMWGGVRCKFSQSVTVEQKIRDLQYLEACIIRRILECITCKWYAGFFIEIPGLVSLAISIFLGMYCRNSILERTTYQKDSFSQLNGVHLAHIPIIGGMHEIAGSLQVLEMCRFPCFTHP